MRVGGWVRGVRVRQEMSNEKESERDARRERERERGGKRRRPTSQTLQLRRGRTACQCELHTLAWLSAALYPSSSSLT